MLSQGELEQAVIGAKDIPGWKTDTVLGRGGDGFRIAPTIVDVSRLPRITPAACEPLFDMTQMLSRHQYRAVVEQFVRTLSGKDEKSAEMTLRSYSVADAPQVMGDLRASLRTCSSFRSPDPGVSWADPVLLADPQLGDEAVVYRMTQIVPSVDRNGNNDGGPPVKAPFSFVVARSGATIAAFYDIGFPAETHLPQVPLTIVKAQIDKLDRLR